MKEIFQEYGGLIIAVILVGLLIAYITMADTGFAAQLTSGISKMCIRDRDKIIGNDGILNRDESLHWTGLK